MRAEQEVELGCNDDALHKSRRRVLSTSECLLGSIVGKVLRRGYENEVEKVKRWCWCHREAGGGRQWRRMLRVSQRDARAGEVEVRQRVHTSKMARRCELRNVRLVKEMENRVLQMPDSGD